MHDCKRNNNQKDLYIMALVPKSGVDDKDTVIIHPGMFIKEREMFKSECLAVWGHQYTSE